MVEANIFSRLIRIIQSSLGNVVSSAEDPEKILDQVMIEMQTDLVRMRQASAQVVASQRQLQAKFDAAQETSDNWLRRAELAVAKGEDELAREALKKRKAYADVAASLKKQLDLQSKAVDTLMSNSRMLESKMNEAKSKKETLKARAATAKTSKQIQELVSGINTGSSAFAAFEKMEEKVIAMEAETESITMMATSDNLESKFAQLEGGTVEDELAALKRAGRPRQAPASLPPGRPYRDAIDLELDALRQKVWE